MTRDEIQREISDIDRELNRVLGSAKLPSLEARPFPAWTWILAFVAAAWWMFGSQLPVIQNYHRDYGEWGLYASLFFGLFALLSTLSWMFRRRGGVTEEYRAATEKSRDLQERRRELQVRLRELEAE
jgi:hypothetical protein